MALLIGLGIIIVLLGALLLVFSYNKTLEQRTIEKIHKDFRKQAIGIGWGITALGIILILWGFAAKAKMISKRNPAHPANIVEN